MRRAVCAALLGLVCAASCAKPAAPPPGVSVPPPPARAIPAANRSLIAEFKKRGFEAREAEEGVVLYLPTVYLFSFDDATVDPGAKQQLREIAGMLQAPTLATRRIVVEGHADAVGSDAYNLSLSERRAVSVIAELVSGGVRADRLVKRAYGRDRPLEPNRRPDGSDNPEGRARNRRVALIIENGSMNQKSAGSRDQDLLP
jgi:outer membrane protein OmpA-like peptidoglycan-associated protein